MNSGRAYDPKSVVLAVLVSISLLLTMKIWMGMPVPGTTYEPFSPRPSAPQDAGLGNLIAPGLVIIHTGPDVHYGVVAGTPDYDKIWDKGKSMGRVLSLITGIRKEAATLAEVQQARAESYTVEFAFKDGYRLVDLARIYGAGHPDLDIVVDRLIVSFGKTVSMYVRSYPTLQYFALVTKQEGVEFLDSIKNVTLMAPKRYMEMPEEVGNVRLAPATYVPRDTQLMAPMSVQRDPSGATAVLSTFFVDVSLLRKIEERDGALIYSDGRRGVRIYPSGAMDYGQPEPGGTQVDKITAIEKAAQFALEHGGLPGTAYADRVTVVQSATHEGTRVRFNFRYAGIPIIGSRGVIEILVSSKGPQEFLRNFRSPTGEIGTARPVLSPREAINAISANKTRVFGDANPGQVVSMELAYLNGAPEDVIERLGPVWAVEFSGGWSLTVNAYNGAVLRRFSP